MSDPVDLNLRRWEKPGTLPKDFDPLTALDAAREHIKKSSIPIKHVIVLYGWDDGTGCDGSFTQAGSYRYFEQLGLLTEGIALLRESATK